ncbi:MAG: tetratricopeptide repeat protein [Pseudomonadota bacterium]|nr:tetratricopeptide repeat protein [Pseudomonadota bacterium]
MKVSLSPARGFERPIVSERLIFLGLALAVLAVFGRLAAFDFVFFDDQAYVLEKAQVWAGLTPASVWWALKATDAGFWHPLTWISLMIDHELWGLAPGGYHLTNVLLHLTATLLLFAGLRRLTGAVVQSAFVAALFALHPLHVESVAWIAARKDVLSGCFWMLTLLLYARYVERPGWGRYLLTLLSFLLGLAAKSMVVTLPVILLLLDFWPCGRLTAENRRRNWRLAVGEKAPFLLLGAVVGMATVAAEQQAGALKGFAEFPLAARLANAAVAYGFYLYKTAWPADLAVHYLHPGRWPAGMVALSLALLTSFTFLAVKTRQSRPFYLVGWLWYLIGLLPVIGLLQIGTHAFADRYAYIPLIGVFIAVVWGVGDWAAGRGEGRVAEDKQAVASSPRPETGAEKSSGLPADDIRKAARLSAAPLADWETSIPCGVNARRVGQGEVAGRRDADALAAATPPGAVVVASSPRPETGAEKSPDLPADDIRKAARPSAAPLADWETKGVGWCVAASVKPGEPPMSRAAAVGMGLAALFLFALVSFQQVGWWRNAETLFRRAVAVGGENWLAVNNLGAALSRQGRYEEAASHFETALRLRPDYDEARFNLAAALAGAGRYEEALALYREVIARRPDFAAAHNNIAIVYAETGDLPAARRHFSEALRIRPDYREALRNLEIAEGKHGSAKAP